MKTAASLVALGILTALFACGGGGGGTTHYSVIYDGNGYTSGAVPSDPNAYAAGKPVTVLDNTGPLVKVDDSFSGWNTEPDGSGTAYTAGDTFVIGTSNVTLYAQWTGAGAVSGTVSGKVLIPTDTEAVLAGYPVAATCPVPVLGNIQAQAFAVRFGTYSSICTDFGSNPFCALHPDAEAVTVIFADLSQDPHTAPGLAPGTYPVTPNPETPDPQTSGPLIGTSVVAFSESLATNATCVPAATVAKGSLQVETVSATEITGQVYLRFGTLDSNTGTFTPSAGAISGTFSAPVCTQTISNTDLCAIAVSGPTCSAPTCT